MVINITCLKYQEVVLYLQPLNTLAWQIRKLYSILVYQVLFTQAPIRVCLDGTIIDSRTILVTMYQVLLLLTQGYYQWGTRLNTM